MKKLATRMAPVLAAGIAYFANAQGLGWMEMPQGTSGAVYATATQTNGAVVVSGDYPAGSHWGYWLFNQSSGAGQKWLVAAKSGWAVYQFADNDRWAVTNYILRSTDVIGRDPSAWTLEGSNDLADNTRDAVAAATWRVVHTHSTFGQPFNGTPWAETSFDCSMNQTAYNAYRLNITQNAGGDFLALGQWKMSGDSGAAQVWQSAPSNILHDAATLNGFYENHSGESFAFYVLCDVQDHGADLDAWQAAGVATPVAEPAPGAFTLALAGLTPLTLYHTRICAVADSGVEAWSAPAVFTTHAALPTVVSLPPDNVTESSATARGELVFAPGGNADIRLLWGKQNNLATGAWQHTNEVSLGASAGPLSFALGPLETNTEYFYAFAASNGFGFAASPAAASFTTLGAPLFGAVEAVAFSDAVLFKTGLASAGETPTRVSLWTGATPSGLALQKEWPATSVPKSFEWLLDPLPAGSTLHYAFMASNTVSGAAVVKWTQTNAVVVANAALTWRAASQNLLWDATSLNWQPSAGGAAMAFTPGDGAVFATANTTVILAGDMAAERVHLGANNLTITGGHDLWVLREIYFDNLTASLATPRLTGSGGLSLLTDVSGNLAVANPANDYAGGTRITQGTISATLSAASATLLGTGGVTLGRASPASANATLALSRETGAGVFTNATPGALTLNGVFNTGRLNLAAGTAARFASLARPEHGASMRLIGAGTLLLDDPPAGVLPPWFVYSGNGGDYAVYEPGAG
ncbi:MAG: hypothetical protein FWF96_07015, partial [Kiritimatiellaeota bacterium]|nr:hypothetical protein [Kiritimatiellota bacterium]